MRLFVGATSVDEGLLAQHFLHDAVGRGLDVREVTPLPLFDFTGRLACGVTKLKNLLVLQRGIIFVHD